MTERVAISSIQIGERQIVLNSADIERFWAQVNRSGPTPVHRADIGECWVWTSSCAGVGYGAIYVSRCQLATHRVSWVLANGDIPKGMWVLHHCDNRKCVKPDHLFLGTNQDNIADMHRKGRGHIGPGTANPHARLSERDVVVIRQRYALGGTTYQEIADEFGVSRATIGDVICGRCWKSVPAIQIGG